jgi:hypothetical protein
MGTLYEASGQTERAVRAYARALSLEPKLGVPEYNPHIIDNQLVEEAMLLAYRDAGSKPQAPKIYQDPGRIAGLLLPPMPAAAEEAPAEVASEDEEMDGGEAGAADATTLSDQDLDDRAINQATPQGAPGYRSPANRSRTWSRRGGGAGGSGAPATGRGVPQQGAGTPIVVATSATGPAPSAPAGSISSWWGPASPPPPAPPVAPAEPRRRPEG